MTIPQPNNLLTGGYGYNNTAQRWYNTATGQFVSEQAVTDEMRVHQTATYSTLDNLTRQLYSGGITLEQWQIGVTGELRDAHLAQAMYAVGGRNNMGFDNFGRVGGTLADEYRYLANFANDIASGNVSEATALARIRQYGNSTQQSYWREYSNATPNNQKITWKLNPAEHCSGCLDLAAGSPYTSATLPTYPGAGATPCRGNCNCILERE
jgi:hypothetical protein